eukprot:IDg16530t1
MQRRNRAVACCALSVGPVRRDRYARLANAPKPAFLTPAAAATALAAAAAVAAAIRALLSGRMRRRMAIALRKAQRRVHGRMRPPAARPATAPLMYANALDELRTRASAKLDAAGPRVVPADPVAYGALSAPRRAELLDEALRAARFTAATTPAPEPTPALPVQAPDWNAAIAFWRVAENINGRAAALGFALCLLREAVEPTHPSLLTQVRDVLVPVAVNTPPFLVAVVDRITDWLT